MEQIIAKQIKLSHLDILLGSAHLEYFFQNLKKKIKTLE